jgi:hypothetical protein
MVRLQRDRRTPQAREQVPGLARELPVLHRTDHQQGPELAEESELRGSRQMDHPREQVPGRELLALHRMDHQQELAREQVQVLLALHRTDHQQGLVRELALVLPVSHQTDRQVLGPEGSPASHQMDHRQVPAREREPAQESQAFLRTDRQLVLEQELGLAWPVFLRMGHQPVRELAREPELVS